MDETAIFVSSAESPERERTDPYSVFRAIKNFWSSRSASTFPLLLLGLGLLGCADLPEIWVQPTSGTQTSEDGGRQVLVRIQLLEEPASLVIVRAVSSDPGEGAVSAPVRFDPSNWREPQFITVRGVDDEVADGDVSYDVTFEASPWPNGDFVELRVVPFLNLDRERTTSRPSGRSVRPETYAPVVVS